MSVDADHQVIDSPEALFRHLYEDHRVEEARDLDPLAAPVHFWLRRHAELEREERAAASGGQPRRPEGTGPDQGVRTAPPGQQAPGAGGREGRRPAAFADPLVEALARALIGRGHDEAAVRGAIRAHATRDGRAGEAAVRADLVEPMLRAATERLLATHRPDPGDEAPPPDRAGGDRPEAVWAGLWADLAGGAAGGRAEADGAPRDDLMAVADAVQRARARPARGRGDAGDQSR